MSNPDIDTTVNPMTLGSALADAIERVAPAVVHVRADSRLASGAVWSASDGHVVTTSRLFHEAREATIEVDTINGTRSATLVGVDETTELALIKVEGGDLADTGWSAPTDRAVRLGTFVAPIARTASGVRATFGIVSRVGPAWVTARGGTVDSFIDVDGQLPPGFSGGPLIDLAGTVIGVNTRGLIQGGATLPTATVRRVVALLASGAMTTPGHLGVAIQEVDLPDHLRHEGAAKGLLVTGVVPGSGAEAAGILVGDTLIAIDGHATTDHAHLLAALAGKAGSVVKVKLARHGQPLEVDATPSVRADKRRGHAGAWAQWAAHHVHGGHPGHGQQGHGGRGWWGRSCR